MVILPKHPLILYSHAYTQKNMIFLSFNTHTHIHTHTDIHNIVHRHPEKNGLFIMLVPKFSITFPLWGLLRNFDWLVH